VTIVGREESADVLWALGQDLSLDPASAVHSPAALQAEFMRLWSELLPGTSADFSATPLSFAFLACCSRYASRPAYRIDGQWITWADCAQRVVELAVRVQRSLPESDREARVPVVAAMMHVSPRADGAWSQRRSLPGSRGCRCLCDQPRITGVSSRQPNSDAKSTDTRACTRPCRSKKRCLPSSEKTPSCQMSGWI
jgi:hypothetical protein